MDILCTEICPDDMQFEYIAACCYRPSGDAYTHKNRKGSIFVEVERLIDFRQKFAIFTKLIQDDEFKRYLKYHSHSSFFDENDNKHIEELWPDEKTAQLLKLPLTTVKQWHQITRNQNQQKLLSINRLDASDWPDGPKEFLYQTKENWSELNPFIFYMEGFPTKGGKAKYKTRLRTKLKELNDKFRSFGRIVAPLELDIQVSPKNGVLNKDLDNIILGIADVFSDELLEKGSYIHGYRIYVLKEQKIPSINSLRFKLLPFYEISNFESRITDVLNLGIEWLEGNN